MTVNRKLSSPLFAFMTANYKTPRADKPRGDSVRSYHVFGLWLFNLLSRRHISRHRPSWPRLDGFRDFWVCGVRVEGGGGPRWAPHKENWMRSWDAALMIRKFPKHLLAPTSTVLGAASAPTASALAAPAPAPALTPARWWTGRKRLFKICQWSLIKNNGRHSKVPGIITSTLFFLEVPRTWYTACFWRIFLSHFR